MHYTDDFIFKIITNFIQIKKDLLYLKWTCYLNFV